MAFDSQPVLRGTLVELRPLRRDDYDALYAVASDPLIWEQHPENDRHTREVFRRFFDEAMASGGALIANDVQTGQVIGSSRFHGYNAQRSEVEIGWTFLARSHWGGRYNGEMKRLMLDHAFAFVDTVLFYVGPSNIRSQRAVEKIGAVHIGVSANDAGQERYVYAISGRPNYSGEWILNVGASVLSPVVAPVVQSGFVRIEHREPTVKVHLSITMDGKPFEVRFERPSVWDGETLRFVDREPTPEGELTIAFQYQLEDSGRRLRATERLQGPGRAQDNVWVFDRAMSR